MKAEPQENPPPLVLSGLHAVQYALRHPHAQLLRQGLFDRHAHAIGVDTACWLAQRGQDGQVFVHVLD